MDLLAVVNIGSVLVSISAMIASSMLARNQFLAQRHGNHVDPMIGLLKEFRSLEFHRNYAFIRDELPALESDGGISGLDEEAQRKIYDVGYFLQLYAILAHRGILDEQFVRGLLRRRYLEIWNSLEPFVHRERELKGLPDSAILNVLEEFAHGLRTQPGQDLHRALVPWRPRSPWTR